jgi:hypothetical protein
MRKVSNSTLPGKDGTADGRSDDDLAAIPVPARLDLTISGRASELRLNGLEMSPL